MSEGNKSVTVKGFFEQDNVKNKFKELLGQKSQGFITSVLQIAMSNDLLAKADPMSIYNAAATAATLDLPLNNNLGFAWIVPYNIKQKDGSYQTVAQFQIGAKGFKQLALRTGQFININSTDVKEGELKLYDRLTGEIEFEWIQDTDARNKAKTIGYVSFFKLLNGFSQTFYMSRSEMEGHGKKYSQTFKKGYGLWNDDFDSMALKTVTKLNLSKNAPLSIEMQKAIITDQGIINDDNGETVTYIDREIEQGEVKPIEETELDRAKKIIANWKSLSDVEKAEKSITSSFPELFDLIELKKSELRNA